MTIGTWVAVVISWILFVAGVDSVVTAINRLGSEIGKEE